MKKNKLTKKQLVEQYCKTVNEYLDICEWVTHIEGEDVCGFVYGILSKNDIDKPLPIQEFYELYTIKYNEKLLTKKDGFRLETNEVLDVIYDLLSELITT